jgi:hypothetical protein
MISCNQKNISDKIENRDTILINNKMFFLDSISESEFKNMSLDFPKQNDTLPIDTTIVKINKDFIKVLTQTGSIDFKIDTSLTDNYAKYIYKGIWKEVNIVHIAGGFMESSADFLISLKNGQKTMLWGNPKLSPDKTKVLSYSYDLQAGFINNGIQMYNFGINGQLNKIYECEIKNWGPVEIKWESDTSILIKRAKLDNEMQEHFDFKRMIIKN